MDNFTLKTALLLTASVAGIVATPVWAQKADGDASDIIVTARRIQERLQDVPASINVFGQQKLDEKNVRSVLDLATFAPSLSVNTRFGAKGASFSLRGFSQATRTASSVGVYFADVVAPRGGNGSTPAGDGATPGSFFDLENVQVVNGPQGTLFGRNTTGGAVILVPKRPTDKYEGYVEGSYGNYDYKRLQGVLNIPITNTIKFRGGVDYLDRDGFIKNISGIGPSKYGDQSYIAARASLLIDVMPDVENYTVATYSYAHDKGPVSKITNCTNTFPFGLLSCQQLARDAGRGFYTVEGALPNPHSKALQWQVINTTTWKASETLTLKNIASYSQVRTNFITDILGANYVIPVGAFGPIPSTGALGGSTLGFAQATRAPGANNADQQNVVEEFRAQGTAADSRLNWQAGAYFEHSTPRKPTGTQAPNLIACSDSDNYVCTDVIGLLFANLPPANRARSIGFLGNQAGEVSFLNRALYAQATYAVLDNLKLTGGFRYTWDKTRARGELRAYRFVSPTGAALTVPIVSCTLGAAADANCRTDGTQKSSAPTWLLGVDYNPRDNILLYAKYTRGYRQGAVTYNVPPPYQSFGPEQVDAYEIGAKTSFSGAISGTFNVAAFYNNLKNQQINVNLASSTNATTATSATLNAGKSEISGVEVDASLRPFSGFTIDGNLEYLHTVVKSLDVQKVPGGIYDVFTPAAVVGGRLPLVPKWKWNLTGTYQLPVPAYLGRVSASMTYSRATGYIYTTGVFGTVDGVGLLSANLNWKAIYGKPIDISLFGTNLTAKKYYTAVNDLSGSGGFVSKYFGEPRTYGVRIKYSFGE
ncbi:iron complex outermembrane recepter protein [Sphingomonas sp. YR710]|uniref:TonB-dependent receptor n=1 Tax=Sphingomonas sp. YR710 TaxID=1882773 RepID=UPI00087F5AD3|nr:TonB-dependent receptor [Sphingomonas sp. YR710]SDC97388.1 iron complex outermembrane recepter protein [Sphingomonas sp. YR710]